MSGYRRRGVQTEPRTQVVAVERHVRASWSLPLFASVVTMGLMLIMAMPGTSTAQAEARVPARPQEGQSIVVSGERDLAALRESGYTVTDPPKATAPASGIPDPGSAKAIAYDLVLAKGWGSGEFDCLVALWTRESHWNVYAHNPKSGAYGIPQALPGDKMASVGADWASNPTTQIIWGLGYIQARYQTPCGAWGHSERKGWY